MSDSNRSADTTQNSVDTVHNDGRSTETPAGVSCFCANKAKLTDRLTKQAGRTAILIPGPRKSSLTITETRNCRPPEVSDYRAVAEVVQPSCRREHWSQMKGRAGVLGGTKPGNTSSPAEQIVRSRQISSRQLRGSRKRAARPRSPSRASDRTAATGIVCMRCMHDIGS